jgi:CRP-like cAMP-binding protein
MRAGAAMEQTVKTFKAGETIFRQGEPGDVAYFILKGKVEIVGPQERRLATVEENTIIGEMALIDPAPRMASAVALGDCECRVITGKTFAQIIKEAPPLAAYLLRSLIRTQRQKAGVSSRPDETALADKTQAQEPTKFRSQKAFNKIFDRRVYPEGAEIFKQGGPGDSVYIIQSGEVEARKKPEGDAAPIVLRKFGPGEVFGERAVFQKIERTAGAYAVTPVTCEVVPSDDFTQALKNCPPILVGLLRIYVGTY